MKFTRVLALIFISLVVNGAPARAEDLTSDGILKTLAVYKAGQLPARVNGFGRFEGVAEAQMRLFFEQVRLYIDEIPEDQSSEKVELAVLEALEFYTYKATIREVLGMASKEEKNLYPVPSVDWDLHFFRLINNENRPIGSVYQQSESFQRLHEILHNTSSPLVEQKALSIQTKFIQLLVKIALEQGELTQATGIGTKHIELAINLLAEIGIKEAIQALVTIATDSRPNPEPKRLAGLRTEVAQRFANNALANLAKHRHPDEFAKACATILLQ